MQLLEEVHLSTNTIFDRQLLFLYILPQKFGSFIYSGISTPFVEEAQAPFLSQSSRQRPSFQDDL